MSHRATALLDGWSARSAPATAYDLAKPLAAHPATAVHHPADAEVVVEHDEFEVSAGAAR